MTPLEAAIVDATRACTADGCEQLIAFARGEGGGVIPFEVAASPAGDLELRLDGYVLVAHVIREQVVHEQQLGLDLAVEQRELGPRYLSHWDRCPGAPAFRR